MSNFAWGSPACLWLLGFVPAAVVLAIYAERRRKHALHMFANTELHLHLTSELDRRRRMGKLVLFLAAWVFAVLAASAPSWDAHGSASGKRRDIVVVLDVSRSMLAEDLGASRLEYARQGLLSFAARSTGDRLGLVVFAGSAALRCPLSTDYDFFRLAVEGSSTDSARMGGTQIAGAIRTALKDGFDDLSQGSKHILLITDAEDHGRAAASAAEEAARQGVRVSVVGLGDDLTGARIPVSDPASSRYLTYQGHEVWSRLNAPAIRHIAEAGLGKALIVGTKPATDPGLAFEGLISGAQGKPAQPRTQAFWIPLALAILALAAELGLSERKKL
jgi:Ca-activated chloride channel homolog